MKIISVPGVGYASNCYCIVSGGAAFAVDPSAKPEFIMNALRAENAVLEGILLTHGHFDHITYLDKLRESENISAYIHSADAEFLSDSKKNGNYLLGYTRVYKPADALLEDGREILLGGEKIRVIHTPGHTKGSVCYLCGEHLITGDTLFSDTVGRCDLYGGDFEEMRKSIEKLALLDGELRIYPGHGPAARLSDALRIVKDLF